MPYVAMTRYHKHIISSLLKWVSSTCVDTLTIGSFYSPRRLFSRKASVTQNEHFSGKTNKKINGLCNAQKEAQSALLDYLYYTRNMAFTVAESMSKNCPDFLDKLLETVGDSDTKNVGKSVSQYLRYSPINEFEPFYESLGLKFDEYSAFLPRDLPFLSDDELLLENYKVLCNYGVERKYMHKIVKEEYEVFRYEYGILAMKLEAYERLGLSRSFVAKMVVCSPYLLIGNVNDDLVQVILILRKAGIDMSLIEEHLSERTSYNWSRLLALLNMLQMRFYNEWTLGCLRSVHPGMLFEDSGNWSLLLIGYLTKFGCDNNHLCSVFQGFPKLEVAIFVANMRRSFKILKETGMQASDIGKVFRAHALLLGSYTLKTVGTMMSVLNVGKGRLRKFILENPQELRNLKVGSKVGQLRKLDCQSERMKHKFLSDLGFKDEPDKMAEAIKKFRCSGAKMQERFDFLVEAGLDKKDVCKMVKTAPHILNMSKDVLKNKIDFLVNDLGYPLTSLVTFPAYLNFNKRRVQLRLAIYSWLKEEGRCDLELSWSTLLAYSDKIFLQRWVEQHPRGLQVFEDFKRKIYSDSGFDQVLARAMGCELRFASRRVIVAVSNGD